MYPLTAGRVLFPLLLAGLAGCAADAGHPPVARASADPIRISENDGFQTLVILDGTASADPIDDPNGERSLTYQWKIHGDEYRYESGSSDSSAMTMVRFRGDRPATISLSVFDEDGLSNTASFELQLTVD